MQELKQLILSNYISPTGRIKTRSIPKDIKEKINYSTNFLHTDEPLTVRIRFILNDMYEPIYCKSCNTLFPQRKIENNYFKSYCSTKCVNTDHTEHSQKRKATCLKKYGVENPMMNEIISDKCHTSKLKTVKEKYGVNNVFQIDAVKEKIKTSYQTNFGVAHPMQLAEIREKQQKTTLNEYGKKNILDNFNPDLSEKLNMYNNGFYRVWNTGNSVWIIKR